LFDPIFHEWHASALNRPGSLDGLF